MTRVVLLGSPPGPIGSAAPAQAPPTDIPLAGLPGTPTAYERLLGQVTKLDPRPVTLARPADAEAYRNHPGTEVVECADLAADLRALAGVAESATENLLILPADALVHDELLYQLTTAKRAALALIIRDEGADTNPDDENRAPEIGEDVLEGLPVRASVGGGRVITVGSAFHRVTHPNAAFLGPLHLHQRHMATTAETARELADMAHLFGPEDDVTQVLVFGLVRGGVSVGSRARGDLFFQRLHGPADEAVQTMTAMNEDKARLDNAVKGADGFFTTYFVSTYSRFIARWAARRGLTPNQVTLISIFLGLCAAGAFATGNRVGYVAGGALIYFAFVFDCVDGQLARYARKFGVLGAWLDATFDRFKEYAVYVGLAVGAAVSGQFGDGQGVWDLALTAIALQTVKHLLDFSFGAANRRKPPVPLPTLDLAHADDVPLMEGLAHRRVANSRGIRGLIRFWSRAGRYRAVHWARKMIVFPIGERFAAIAIVTALFDPRITFLTLIAWGTVATAYTVTGRILRSAA